MRALVTLSGRGESHLSGFHSAASGPQMSGSVFKVLMPMMTVVFFGTYTSLMVLPSLPLIGDLRGRIVSRRALQKKSASPWLG